MGTHDKAVYYKLRDVLNADDAIASEAAAVAMGLVFIGVSGEAFNEPYTEMIQVCSVFTFISIFPLIVYERNTTRQNQARYSYGRGVVDVRSSGGGGRVHRHAVGKSGIAVYTLLQS
jgi:hypothetical protein